MPYKDREEQLRYMRRYAQKRFHEKVKAAGLCVNCYKEPQSAGTLFCVKCRIFRQDYQKKYSEKLRDEAYVAYGGKCACCGETNPCFLTIDHVNGGGTRERKRAKSPKKSRNYYLFLKRMNYPSSYQLLCYNCNLGRERNGGICPHQEPKE